MRLLVDEEWFDAVSSEGQYESDFESLLRGRSRFLFPEYYVASFEIPVESEEGRKLPDLALIDRHYRHWWVVEVEMAHHSLYRHVLPQVAVFARGRYGDVHCDYMLAKCDEELDRAALSDMVKGAQPRVLVIVNRSMPNWIEPIRQYDALLTVVEVFRSGRNHHILRINGDYPEGSVDRIVSVCRLDNCLPRLLEIDSPAALGIANGEQVSIEFNGGLTDWTRFDASDKVWLNPLERNPLSLKQEYHILKDSDGRLSFKAVV